MIFKSSVDALEVENTPPEGHEIIVLEVFEVNASNSRNKPLEQRNGVAFTPSEVGSIECELDGLRICFIR